MLSYIGRSGKRSVREAGAKGDLAKDSATTGSGSVPAIRLGKLGGAWENGRRVSTFVRKTWRPMPTERVVEDEWLMCNPKTDESSNLRDSFSSTVMFYGAEWHSFCELDSSVSFISSTMKHHRNHLAITFTNRGGFNSR